MVAPLVVSEDGAELMIYGWIVLGYFCLGVVMKGLLYCRNLSTEKMKEI